MGVETRDTIEIIKRGMCHSSPLGNPPRKREKGEEPPARVNERRAREQPSMDSRHANTHRSEGRRHVREEGSIN